MPSEITDALIARTVQTRRMMEAGLDYWRRGHVRRLDDAPTGAAMRAWVEGGAVDPYDVRLRLAGSGAALRVVGSCTCPVGEGCKHLAAALFAWRAKLDQQGLPHADGRPLFPPRPEVLPAALSQWLTAMRPLRLRADAAPAPERAVLYVVRAQAPSGSARTGPKRPVASLAPAGSPLRLVVEAFHVALDRSGRPCDGGTRVQPPPARHGPIRGPVDARPAQRGRHRLSAWVESAIHECSVTAQFSAQSIATGPSTATLPCANICASEAY